MVFQSESIDSAHQKPMSEAEKQAVYDQVLAESKLMLGGERDQIVLMATLSCLLKLHFSYFYWVGFYRLMEGRLVIGPYQGTPGCLRIELGSGVCGVAARERKTQMVEDVHQFPGHIACDPASRSEIVVPVINGQKDLLGVLDVDSDQPSAFDPMDKKHLEILVSQFFNNL